jgi:hypothetical protein
MDHNDGDRVKDVRIEKIVRSMGPSPDTRLADVRREMRIHGDAKCDSAGVRIRQHEAAQNARTRGHHSGERGFLGNYASYPNWASGQHRIRTCDLYGVKPARRYRVNREKSAFQSQENNAFHIMCETRGACNRCRSNRGYRARMR